MSYSGVKYISVRRNNIFEIIVSENGNGHTKSTNYRELLLEIGRNGLFASY